MEIYAQKMAQKQIATSADRRRRSHLSSLKMSVRWSFIFVAFILVTLVDMASAVEIVPHPMTAPHYDAVGELTKQLATLKKIFSDTPITKKRGQIYLAPLLHFSWLPLKDHLIFFTENGIDQILIISGGTVSIEDIATIKEAATFIPVEQVKGALHQELVQRGIERAVFLKLPIFITSTGGLLVHNVALLMDVKRAPVILANGNLRIDHAVVAAAQDNPPAYVPMAPISHQDANLYGVQHPRPYILALDASTLAIGYSLIEGLGYRNLFGGFGIGAKQWPIFFSCDPKLLLLKPGTPHVYLYKNTIKDCFMGFYSNLLKKAIIVGNHLIGNWKYGFNIHDWSNVYIANNIVEQTHLAHGIIFSRYSKGIIYHNLTMNNGGAGIMLDRLSDSIVVANFCYGNKTGGITIQEAANVTLEGNILMRNSIFGLFVRNSQAVLAQANEFIHNIGPGAKVITADLSRMVYRNLLIDIYKRVSWTWLRENKFEQNLRGDISLQRGGAAGLERNHFVPQMRLLTGEARLYNHLVLERPLLVISGEGNPRWVQRKLFMVDSRRLMDRLLSAFAQRGNIESLTIYGIDKVSGFAELSSSLYPLRILRMRPVDVGCARQWLLSAALQGEPTAMSYLGLIKLKYPQNGSDITNGLRWLTRAIIFGGKDAPLLYEWAPRIFGISDERAHKIFREETKNLDCTNFSPPPWPAKKNLCGIQHSWKRLLQQRFRTILTYSRYCYSSQNKRSSSLWHYALKRMTQMKKRSFKLALNQYKKMLNEKNIKKRHYYRELERLQADMKKELLNEDPQLMRLFTKKEEFSKVQSFILQRTLAEDIKRLHAFRKECLTLNR